MSKLVEVYLMKGKAVTRIMTEMMNEQIGSATFMPNHLTRQLDKITPALPRASARICKYTPVKFSF
jgi:hypothetical protein